MTLSNPLHREEAKKAALLFTHLRKIRLKQTEAIDRRTRLLTEIIANIRAVKVYAWESTFGTKIAELRKQEIIHLRRYGLLRSTIASISNFTPIAAAISVFVSLEAGVGHLHSQRRSSPTLCLVTHWILCASSRHFTFSTLYRDP